MEHNGDQPSSSAEHALFTTKRTVLVKGSGGVTATVVVTMQKGKVWLSIQPPFTWEAIMDPAKVDEVIRALAQAAHDAQVWSSRNPSPTEPVDNPIPARTLPLRNDSS